MNILITLLGLLFVTSIGFGVIQLFDLLPKKNILFGLSLGFGLGVGFIHAQLFIYSQIGFFWTRETILIPWIIFLVVVIYKKRYFYQPIKWEKIKLDLVEKGLLGGIMLTMGYVFFEAVLRPATTWDSWATWLFKAKAFFIEGHISSEILSYVGAEYPLVVSFLGTFIYILIGHIDDTAVLLNSFAFLVFLALGFFCVLQKEYGTKYALLGTFFLVTIQNFVRHGGRIESGIADLPFSYYLFISTILLLDYYKTTSTKILTLLTLFIGITALIKVESVPITSIYMVMIVYHIYKKKKYTQLWILLFWLIPVLEWNGYKKLYNLSYMGNHLIVFVGSSVGSVFQGVIKEMLNIKTWNLLWISYFLTLGMNIRTPDKRIMLINTVILFQLTMYLFIYLFISGFEPESSIERLLLHIAPLALYVVLRKWKSIIST